MGAIRNFQTVSQGVFPETQKAYRAGAPICRGSDPYFAAGFGTCHHTSGGNEYARSDHGSGDRKGGEQYVGRREQGKGTPLDGGGLRGGQDGAGRRGAPSDFVCWDPNSESGEIRGAETIKGEIEYFRQAVPDLTYTVEDQVAEGDKVVTRYRASGTHQGEFFRVAPTGNRVEFTGIQIDRFEESGKLVEEWPEYDLLGAMRQMGAIPEAGQEEARPEEGEREEQGLIDRAKDKEAEKERDSKERKDKGLLGNVGDTLKGR